jgi:pimeloyl-ACP methyl ester carboxylesterase
MHRFITTFLVIVLLFSGVLSVKAATTRFISATDLRGDVTIARDTTITPGISGEIAHFSLQNQAKLIILGGVTLRFQSEASMDVAGTIITPENRTVTLRGIDENSSWKGIRGVLSDSIFQAVTILNTENPLRVEVRGGLQLLDFTCLQCAQGIALTGSVSRLTIAGMTLRAKVYRDAKYDPSIVLSGLWTSIRMKNIAFFDPYQRDESPKISVDGAYGDATFAAIKTYKGCPLRITAIVQNKSIQAGFNALDCEGVTPVLFVPGIGTSVNLPLMTEPLLPNSPKTTGWSLSAIATPSYAVFTDALYANKVPYSIAYYDWRLPADQVVTDYLVPAIDALKKKTGSSAVQIVAHSYGGIITRRYIESTQYRGDIAQTVLVGVPNQGAYKTYPIWESGQIPPDWSFLRPLVKYYSLLFRGKSDKEVIRAMFPSLADLQPIYPALYRGIFPQSINNRMLRQLRDQYTDYQNTVPYSIVYSKSLSTLATAELQDSGETITRPIDFQPGDGTVPEQSALLPDVPILFTSTQGHATLFNDATPTIMRKVLGGAVVQPSLIIDQFRGYPKGFWWVYADCPVTITAISDGKTYSVDARKADSRFAYSSPEMVWLAIPKTDQPPNVTLSAYQDAEVRWWIDDGDPEVLQMKKNQSITLPVGTIQPMIRSPDQAVVSRSHEAQSENQLDGYNNMEVYRLVSLLRFTPSLMRIGTTDPYLLYVFRQTIDVLNANWEQ